MHTHKGNKCNHTLQKLLGVAFTCTVKSIISIFRENLRFHIEHSKWVNPLCTLHMQHPTNHIKTSLNNLSRLRSKVGIAQHGSKQIQDAKMVDP